MPDMWFKDYSIGVTQDVTYGLVKMELERGLRNCGDVLLVGVKT